MRVDTKKRFWILFSSGGSERLFICLSEKKVVFSFVSGNTHSLLLEKTPQKLCLRRERRKDERERLGREAFVGEKKKKRFALS